MAWQPPGPGDLGRVLLVSRRVGGPTPAGMEHPQVAAYQANSSTTGTASVCACPDEPRPRAHPAIEFR